MWSSWQAGLLGAAKPTATTASQPQPQCHAAAAHPSLLADSRHETGVHADALEATIHDALGEELPAIISRPSLAHLAAEPISPGLPSPHHSRSPSHTSGIIRSRPLSRAGTPGPSSVTKANSAAADIRRASSDGLHSPVSPARPTPPSPNKVSTPRPSLLSQLSSRSLHSPSTFSLSSALVGPASSRGQPQLISRPEHIWHPSDSSPSAARHARRFSSIARAGIETEMIEEHTTYSRSSIDDHASTEDARGDVDDEPSGKSFWSTIANHGQPDPDGVVRSHFGSPSTENASSGFLDAMARLRAIVGLPDGEDPHAWLKSHRSELNRALGEEDRFSDSKSGADGSDDFEENLLRLQDKYHSPKNPVIFCHGLFGFRSLGPQTLPALTLQYWRGVVEVLEANGTEVLVTQVPASASIEDRAKVLASQIEERFPDREVNLIGHSMGGLDSRYVISKLSDTYSFRVRSLTTIATPHRGSAFADYMLNEVIGRENLPKLLGFLKTLHIPGGGAAFDNLTRPAMKEFNERVPDDPSCKYYSWGASFRPAFYNEFRIPWRVIHGIEGENDGMVSVESSKWGQYQGTLNNCSHLHLIGWIPYISSAWAEMTGKPIPFRPNTFYLQICEDLAHEGF